MFIFVLSFIFTHFTYFPHSSPYYIYTRTRASEPILSSDVVAIANDKFAAHTVKEIQKPSSATIRLARIFSL